MIKSRKNIPIRAVFYVVILIFVMIQVYPIFWVICSSLKTPDEMTYTAQYALPSGFYLGNYISALTISSIPRYFLTSWHRSPGMPGCICDQQGKGKICQCTDGIFPVWNDGAYFFLPYTHVPDL